MRGLIIAGIGTDVGKTVVSAVVCEALNADYWKPLASGLDAAKGDDESVAALIKNGKDRVHPSTYRFKRALSPHIAAALEGETICLERLMLPASDRPIVVELAGGVLVPLSDDYTNMELIARLDLPVLVVSRHYLGSINHTLLTIEALRARGVAIMGVVFNGAELPDSERIIERLGQVHIIGRIPELAEVSPETIRSVVPQLKLYYLTSQARSIGPGS